MVYQGADEQVPHDVLTQIEEATGERRFADQPDTIIAYGPSNWIYEFVAAGDAAVKAKDYGAAVTYYHAVSQPHTTDKESLDALQKANFAYEMAAKAPDIRFQVVDFAFEGEEFEVFVHLPKGEGPFPVVIASKGSDMSKVTNLSYFIKHLEPNGIAMISLEVPGMGNSSAYDVSDGHLDKLHAATAAWAQTQEDFQPQNVFVQGASFGGGSVARLFLDKPEMDPGGVTFIYGPMNTPFYANADQIDTFPA